MHWKVILKYFPYTIKQHDLEQTYIQLKKNGLKTNSSDIDGIHSVEEHLTFNFRTWTLNLTGSKPHPQVCAINFTRWLS